MAARARLGQSPSHNVLPSMRSCQSERTSRQLMEDSHWWMPCAGHTDSRVVTRCLTDVQDRCLGIGYRSWPQQLLRLFFPITEGDSCGYGGLLLGLCVTVLCEDLGSSKCGGVTGLGRKLYSMQHCLYLSYRSVGHSFQLQIRLHCRGSFCARLVLPW